MDLTDAERMLVSRRDLEAFLRGIRIEVIVCNLH
jgi:hypothetical protein